MKLVASILATALTLATFAFSPPALAQEAPIIVTGPLPPHCSRDTSGTIYCSGYTLDEYCTLFAPSHDMCYGGYSGSSGGSGGSSGRSGGSSGRSGSCSGYDNYAQLVSGNTYRTGFEYCGGPQNLVHVTETVFLPIVCRTAVMAIGGTVCYAVGGGYGATISCTIAAGWIDYVLDLCPEVRPGEDR